MTEWVLWGQSYQLWKNIIVLGHSRTSETDIPTVTKAYLLIIKLIFTIFS